MQGPQFLRFYIPLLEVLQENGGSGKPSEITDLVIEKCGISEKEQNEVLRNGQSRVRNQVAWARFYLSKNNLIDANQRGVWALTKNGLRAKLTEKEVVTHFKSVQGKFQQKDEENPEVSTDKTTVFEIPSAVPPNETYKDKLLKILKNLSPKGFEQICRKLLQDSGFERVEVTGKSSDGGIDGHGMLQINPFVSFKVIFQCKRYKDTVSSPTIRDFRGAMMGRADRGIIITTGTFTTEARKEAYRDGATPIELVDGEDLVGLFIKYELGVKRVEDYVVYEDYFAQFNDA